MKQRIRKFLCTLFGHQEVTAAVHNKNSMRATTIIQTRCKRCGAQLDMQVLSKKQLRNRSR